MEENIKQDAEINVFELDRLISHRLASKKIQLYEVSKTGEKKDQDFDHLAKELKNLFAEEFIQSNISTIIFVRKVCLPPLVKNVTSGDANQLAEKALKSSGFLGLSMLASAFVSIYNSLNDKFDSRSYLYHRLFELFSKEELGKITLAVDKLVFNLEKEIDTTFKWIEEDIGLEAEQKEVFDKFANKLHEKFKNKEAGVAELREDKEFMELGDALVSNAFNNPRYNGHNIATRQMREKVGLHFDPPDLLIERILRIKTYLDILHFSFIKYNPAK